MGAYLGVIKAPTLDFDRAQLFPHDIRVYEPYFVAEIECDDAHLGEASSKLVRYLGLHGVPENVLGNTNAESGPIVVAKHEKIQMVFPVIREDDVLQFILPSRYKDVASIPIPTDAAIVIRSIPQRIVAVKEFRGKGSRKQYKRRIHQLRLSLAEDSMLPSSEATSDDAVHWSVAQYQPRATLSVFRRNEVWIDLNAELPTVAALLNEKKLPKRKIDVAVEEEGKIEGTKVMI